METKDIDCKNMRNVYDMLEGCDAAMVNYGLTDDLKLIRTVTFYNSKEYDFERVSASLDNLNKIQGNISISKNVIYKIVSFTNIIKRGIDFYSMLFKDIPGFIPGSDTHDCRTNKRY